MSINVNQIILHQFVQSTEANTETIKLDTLLRDQPLSINPEVEQFMLDIHQAYQGKAKGFGVFLEESLFAQSLNRFLEQEVDFVPFSQESAKQLAQELAKYPFAASGTFVLCQYNYLATDYLFIALIDDKNSVLVDENLDIHRTKYLNINQFDIAARINLTDLKVNAQSNRYLTFIKGRVGRKIADFFMDFLGAEAGLNPQVQNQTLLQAVSDYCDEGNLNQTQALEVKKQVFEYCKEQINSGEEIQLNDLSENLPTLNETPFVEFAESQDYGLEPSIPPVRSALKTLTKFSGSGKGVTLSFEANLLNDRIIWDEQADTLTIKGLPPNLKDQLQRLAK